MRQTTQTPPVVMTFSGLDPTGGAGLQADIEAIASMGGHAASIATCLTVQTTTNVIAVAPVAASLLVEQARAVLEDMPVRTFKIGALASVDVVEAIHSILRDYPGLPVILDPVINAGGGGSLASEATREALSHLLIPNTTVLTPNSQEARRLASGPDTLDACAMALLSQGCEYVLVTGAHESTPKVINTLYGNNRKLKSYQWDRLDAGYHGSGCTLASAIAGLMAQGQELFDAVHVAQRYTWKALKHGSWPGMGQAIPNRLFWAGKTEY